jgi:S1-C subfamily serine protease
MYDVSIGGQKFSFREDTSGETRTIRLPGQITNSMGAGFFISTEGHIITNQHVVPNCESIKI